MNLFLKSFYVKSIKILSIFLVVFLLGQNAQGQSDTLYMSPLELADSIYSDFDTHLETGRLFNRNHIHKDSSIVWHYANNIDTANADFFYGSLNELKYMSLDTSSFQNHSYFMSAQYTYAKYEFEDEEIVIPIGIIDKEFEYYDHDSAINVGAVTQNSLKIIDNSNGAVIRKKRVQMVAPMYDLVGSQTMYLILKDEWIISDRKDSISKIQYKSGGKWRNISFGEKIVFYPDTTMKNYFDFKVTFLNGDSFENTLSIKTPEVYFQNKATFQCDEKDSINDGLNQMKWCVLYGCNSNNQVIDKPYFIVTGYRPPIIGQTFKKTHQLYNEFHDNYIEDLRLNDFDVILVKYNAAMNPLQTIEDQGELLVELIELINTKKALNNASENENVIQANSLGTDVARYALLKMEYEHWFNNKPHHHTRQFVAYDANLYGANIPLSYQYLIYSMFIHAEPLNFVINPPGSPLSLGSAFLTHYLFTAMEQVLTKQLLKYHAKGVLGAFPFPTHPYAQLNITPTSTNLKTNFTNNLNDFFIPLDSKYNKNLSAILPYSTRNIAVSLGKYSGTNVSDPTLLFKESGDNWSDLSGLGNLRPFWLTTAKYSTNYYHKLFERIRITFVLGFPVVTLHQNMHVKDMQEIDNTSGSYLGGLGNVVNTANGAFFGASFFGLTDNNTRQSTHKPTVSALAIHPDYWPADGSMALDLQDMGLMFTDRNETDPNQDESDFYGYPNVGRPNDHFDITPFEAIAVDARIDRHINLEKSSQLDKERITDFLLNEVEPWYLGLQNHDFGSQARSDYTYTGKYRARNIIYVGSDVTNRTDQGPFTIASNGYLILRAGDDIDLVPGFETEFGARFDGLSGDSAYVQCNNFKIASDDDATTSDENYADELMEERIDNTSAIEEETIEKSQMDIKIYPNPNQNKFTITSGSVKEINQCVIFDIMGKVVFQQDFSNTNTFEIQHELPQGTYFVKVKSAEGIAFTKKLIVL